MDETLRRAGVRDAAARRRAVAEIARRNRGSSLWRIRSPEAVPFLRRLRRLGVPFGVVSNSDGRVRALLRGAGLLRLLPFVVDSHAFGVEKPDPRIFREGCRRLGLPPRDVAYVGDIPSVDVVGARRAGLVPFLYDPRGAYRRGGARGGRRVERLEEVLAALVFSSAERVV